MKRAATPRARRSGAAPRRSLSASWAPVRARLAEVADGVRTRVTSTRAWATASRWGGIFADLVRPLVDAARTGASFVSVLGWTTFLLAVGALGVGWHLGWQEFRIVGLALLVLLGLSALFTIGRTQLDVDFQVDPLRLTVGESAAGHLRVANVARTPLLPVGLEIPVGLSAARFTLAPLRPGGEYSDLVVIPTSHRGVIDIGPVRTQRGDPFGLIRREITWTEKLELFVHPRTVPLDSLGAGLLRDLEGQTTNDVSMSDLAFHTLREYVPGDDRRYIHWRSSAKLSGTSGQSRFLVRQFLDTRRSHIAVVIDVDPDAYDADEEFETALSAGASITLRALADEMDTTIVCGESSAVQPAPHLALDTYSRATYGPHSLAEATGRLNTLAPDVSAVVLVTGPYTDFDVFLRARAHLAPEVRLVALRVRLGEELALRDTSGITVMALGSLAELPLLLRGGVTQ